MNSTKTIKETKLPEKSALFSKLHNSDIAADDYKHAQQVWSHFGCTTFGDYHDIVLLADVFENFWKRCLFSSLHFFCSFRFWKWQRMGQKLNLNLFLIQTFIFLLKKQNEAAAQWLHIILTKQLKPQTLFILMQTIITVGQCVKIFQPEISMVWQFQWI